MRRIPRLRKPKSLFYSLPASHIPNGPLCLATTSRNRDFSSTPQNRELIDKIRNKIWGGNPPGPADPYVSRGIEEDTSTRKWESYEEADTVSRRLENIETDLGLPPRRRTAPRVEDVADPGYAPAETADGLEEVGGFEGWWDDEKNWNPARDFVGFGPREKVTDPASLEVLARMAVAEALAVKASGDGKPGKLLAGLWNRGRREMLAGALALGFQVGDNGSATLTGDVGKVVEALEWQDVSQETEEATPTTREPIITPDEAREFLKTWDAGWKRTSLDDLRLKFAVTKRIQQLTGQVIPDAKLSSIRRVEELLRILVKPPKPKKLIEELQGRADLQKLANVTVHARKVTSIDKEKMVGRWKIIAEELERRGLPVTGMGKHGPSVEKKWASGKA